MFQIGDKIVYPMHGASVIEDIEEKEIMGEKQHYYVFHLPHRNMQVMIPTEKTAHLKIRKVVDAQTVENVLSSLQYGEPDLSVNRHQRHNMNLKKMRSGDIHEVAQVIRDLIFLNKSKKLGTEDKMMLDNAQQILSSELGLVKGITLEEAATLLDQAIQVEVSDGSISRS